MDQKYEYRENEYTMDQLEKAFNSVQNKDDWRAAIDAPVDPESDLILIEAAIQFYTATQAKFEMVGDQLRVRSIGYRMGPAGP